MFKIVIFLKFDTLIILHDSFKFKIYQDQNLSTRL